MHTSRDHSYDRNRIYSAAARFLLTSRSSAMVSLVPLPLGREIQGLMPSPMTKMLVTLKIGRNVNITSRCRDRSQKNAPSSECPVQRVLDVDDIESSNVLLPVHDDTSTTHVATTGDHDDVAGIELDKVGDLASLKVELDGVVDLDEGVGVTDGATVVGDDMGNTTGAKSDLANLEELVGGLLRGDAVDGEATLDIVEHTEVLARLLDGNDIFKISHIQFWKLY